MTEATAVRIEDMRPAEIATLAGEQLDGGFSTQSDAMTALRLVIALANRLEEVAEASLRAPHP